MWRRITVWVDGRVEENKYLPRGEWPWFGCSPTAFNVVIATDDLVILSRDDGVTYLAIMYKEKR